MPKAWVCGFKHLGFPLDHGQDWYLASPADTSDEEVVKKMFVHNLHTNIGYKPSPADMDCLYFVMLIHGCDALTTSLSWPVDRNHILSIHA